MTSAENVVTIGSLLVQQGLDRLIRHGATMFDAVDAEIGHPLDAVVVGGMCRDRQLVAVAFVDHRLQLLVGEFQRVVASHDLDQVGTAAHLFAHRAAHLVGTRRLAADPVGVATGLDDRVAADLQAGAGKDALLDRLLGIKVQVVKARGRGPG